MVAVLQWQEDPSRHALRGVQGRDVDKLPKRWCCAACEPHRGSGDCPCGSRQKISLLSVSHVLGRDHFEREFHKELIPNCMEPYVVSWILFIKSGRHLRSGQSWRCPSGRQCAMETFSWPTIVRPTRRGAWIGRNYSCTSRHNCCKTSTPGHSGLGFRKETFAHFSSPSLFLAETFVLLACFHWSNPSVSWILEFVGVAKLGTPA